MSLLNNLYKDLNQSSEDFVSGLIPRKYWPQIDSCDVYGSSVRVEFKKEIHGGGALTLRGYNDKEFAVEVSYHGNNQLACFNFYAMVTEIIRSIEFNEVEASNREDSSS